MKMLLCQWIWSERRYYFVLKALNTAVKRAQDFISFRFPVNLKEPGNQGNKNKLYGIFMALFVRGRLFSRNEFLKYVGKWR